jgi:diketogulonate reductase-like aldo/keto reductase
VAEETGRPAGQVAIAWVIAKGTLPIIGPRTPVQLVDNLASIDLRLTEDQIARLDAASAIELGFPHDTVVSSHANLAGFRPELIDWPGRAVR